MNDIWLYIAVMSAVTLAIRLTPALLLRSAIKNRFVRSFLFYVPYVTLAVMTFPRMARREPFPLCGGGIRHGADRGGNCVFAVKRDCVGAVPFLCYKIYV